MQTTRSTPVTASPEDTGAAPLRNMHDVLSNWDRRAILYCLECREGPVGLRTVARRLLAWQHGTVLPSREESASVETTRLRLLREHVAAMEEFGVLEYDEESDTLRIPEAVTVSVSPPWRTRTRDRTPPG